MQYQIAFNDKKPWVLFTGVLIIYVLMRALAWMNATVLEDHDSVSLLYLSERLFSFNLQDFMGLNPDSTLFYPFFGALFSLPGWSVETGARLASLVFSIGLFIVLIAIGRRFTTLMAVSLALLILALNPAMIRLSISVLTEPSYIAVIYLGLWVFLTQYNNPTRISALLLGIVFAFGFINRTEGIFFLLAIPMMQFVHFRFASEKSYNLSIFFGWLLFFIMGFSLVALPQILWVSSRMDTLAINGRQTWVQILNNPDGKSYEEKVYGLDYSPEFINVTYLQMHPEESTSASLDPVQMAKTYAVNYRDLYKDKLNELFGPLGLMFLAFGVLAFINSRRYYEFFVIFAFIIVGLVGPLGHNVIIRHIAIIAPLVILLQGIGIMYLSNAILRRDEAN